MSIDPSPLPQHQFACLMPVPVSDYMHYQFYEVCPPSCLYVAYPLVVRSFDVESAEEALAKLPRAIEFLNNRGVDRITLAGLPIAASLGRERCLEVVESVRSMTDIPFTFDAEETLDALQQVGARSIAVAAKWPNELMDRLARYLTDGGYNVLGYSSGTYTASQVTGVTPVGGAKLARDLATAALDAHPAADALVLGGGAWLSLPAIREIERTYAKPVISNPVASCWAALRQVGAQGRSGGLGRLVDSLRRGQA